MLRFAYWITWTWSRLAGAFIAFAAFVFLIVAPVLFHPLAPESQHPVDYFTMNFAKVTGICGYVAAVWSNHYWPRVMAAKQHIMPFPRAWQNYLAGSLLLGVLSLLVTLAFFIVFPEQAVGPMRFVDLAQYLATVTALSFAYLTCAPWLIRNASWLFGREHWMFDSLFLSDVEIDGLNTRPKQIVD